MRTWKNLFPHLLDLDAAARLVLRGKRHTPEGAALLFRREEILGRLEAELRDGTWRPAGYDLLRVLDPKPRIIARAPLEDRVVHAATVRAVAPALLTPLHPEAPACVPGGGTHRARLRLLAATRRWRWFLHLDVRSYFPSIEPALVLDLLERRVRDGRFLQVVAQVLDAGRGIYDDPALRAWAGLPADWPPHGRGLPIGSSTSQAFAAWLYLHEADQLVKRTLRVPGYVRYVDDFFLFADREAVLVEARERLVDHLGYARDLRLKHPDARARPTSGGLVGLGVRVRRSGFSPLPRRWRRLRGAVRCAAVARRHERARADARVRALVADLYG